MSNAQTGMHLYRARATAALFAAVVTLTSCNSPESESSRSEAPAATQAETSGQPRTATCALDGERDIDVVLDETGDALGVVFNGEAVAPSGDSLYSVTVFDAAGENGVQVGMQFLDGEQVAYFIFDFSTAQQVNLPGAIVVDGKRIAGAFPLDEMDALSNAQIASWSAAYSYLG
ncbi:MAG: hypothetical protein WB767_14750, partial [Nocardioides sp.]